MAGGGEDRPLVALQHGEPALNISGVILTRFGSNPKIGTKESRADLGNEFFHCITGIGKPLAAKVAVKPALMSDCVATFMTQGRVVGFTIPEALQFWHLHKVAVGTENARLPPC